MHHQKDIPIALVPMSLPGACAYEPVVRGRIEHHLGPYGVDIELFCRLFDERTGAAELYKWPVKVMVSIFEDDSFNFEFTHSQMLGSPVSFRVPDIYPG